MSFLSEILASKGHAEIGELNDTIKVLNKSVVSLKEELLVNMEDRYMNFTHALDDTNHLDSKIRTLLNQIDDFKRRLDDLMKNKMADSKDQLEMLLESYQEISLAHKLSQQLLEIHKALKEAQDCNDDANLTLIAQRLKTVEQSMKNNTSGLECLEIFETVKAELISQRSKHVNKAAKLWNQGVFWSESLLDNKSKTITLTLASHVNKNELFKTLFLYDMLSLKMLDFGRKLLNDVLFPIMSNITTVECNSDNKLSITIAQKSHSPVCVDVLNNLKIVFNFLYSQFNLNVNDDVSFMSELKKHFSNEFCNYLVNNCLSLTVPKRRDELEGYKAQMEEITSFESVLKEKGFIGEENKCIAEYATNVEELFATKTCEAYLAAARKIMKKDLHDVKEAGPILNTPPAEFNATTTLTELSPYTYQFPNCQISKSSDELLELVSEMLSEVPRNTDTCAVRLFYTARNIFSMYCDIVPQFHSRLLDTIPQQSAILHNNAMYLAHQLMLLGMPLRERLPPVLQCHTATFVDLVDPLRSLATTTLTKQLFTQQKHIVDILRDSGLVTLSDSPKFPDGVEKAIRQCLRQFALLQTVWQHILPIDNYCKALGLLCNTFVIEIIDKVIAAEDISADTASQLVIVIDLIQQKAPQVFPAPLEVQRHVKKWGKLCELRWVLGAELREVGDRWADRKGPLAHEFTAEQVRHLVRALFQISDRRAVLLAKIF